MSLAEKWKIQFKINTCLFANGLRYEELGKTCSLIPFTLPESKITLMYSNQLYRMTTFVKF